MICRDDYNFENEYNNNIRYYIIYEHNTNIIL